ncbi:glycosyltransferase family A protein [Paraburkholderia strydomiana]|uniref:glycosyltransferase family 2 protein n=1 Tax=Paraburkholderia strydomiana TaxID=1245417 RepID=UPI0038BC23C3
MFDITATIIFHREYTYVLPALASLQDVVSRARQHGLNVEARAIVDRPDERTLRLVEQRGTWLDGIEKVDFGDLGLSRNAGARLAKGQYLAFFDGDDLWGADWLTLAYAAATAADAPSQTIWHPELLYYFHESDYDAHSTSSEPHAAARSFHFFHGTTEEEAFDKRLLLMNNVWSANVFAHRSVHEKYPYLAINKQTGFGVEDWSWNIETSWKGLRHLVVDDTVHLIRVKQHGSLGMQNTAEGLLPHLTDDLYPTLGA